MSEIAPGPRVHRFQIGALPAAIVSDGPLDLGPPSEEFDSLPAETVSALAQRHGLPLDRTPLAQNALVVVVDGKPVLFDTGTGPERPFGPDTGRLVESLTLAGFRPDDIGAVMLTHLHSDHVWGLLAASGSAAFPRATVHVDARELAFLADASRAGPFIDRSRAAIAACTDRVQPFTTGAEVIPGIVAIATPGHTVGHTSYRVGSGADAVVVLGDLMHHPMLAERPDLTYRYDYDRSQTAASRRALLARCAAEGTRVLGYHFPWPGLGTFAAAGDGYAFRPL
jgi:glyoxylase-like metal-dependent hydrolase (beta-lactamase superfamily II)